MITLLKQKSKIGVAQKQRKIYDVAAVFKVISREEGKTAYTDTTGQAQQNQDKFG